MLFFEMAGNEMVVCSGRANFRECTTENVAGV